MPKSSFTLLNPSGQLGAPSRNPWRFVRFRERYLPIGVSVWVSRSHFLVVWKSRNNFQYDSVLLGFSAGDAFSQRGEVFNAIWGRSMKRKDVKSMRSVQHHANPEELKELYPSLGEFMTAAVFESTEERRESPTLTLWAAGGVWRLSVKDRAEGLVMWLSAETLADVVSLADAMVLNPDGPWRYDEWSHPANGKRVKKGVDKHG